MIFSIPPHVASKVFVHGTPFSHQIGTARIVDEFYLLFSQMVRIVPANGVMNSGRK
jgi:hypothetical protein